MRFSCTCLALIGLGSSLVASAPLEKRDAEFLQVRTKLKKDMSGRGGDPADKYFRKSFLFSLNL
jgi:hypothetical protein